MLDSLLKKIAARKISQVNKTESQKSLRRRHTVFKRNHKFGPETKKEDNTGQRLGIPAAAPPTPTPTGSLLRHCEPIVNRLQGIRISHLGSEFTSKWVWLAPRPAPHPFPAIAWESESPAVDLCFVSPLLRGLALGSEFSHTIPPYYLYLMLGPELC